uniref:Claudin n=1 Tax=Xiphophorus maculatus TaxID=8083 RepID=A0A3B5QN90_XIPMA
MVSAGLEILGLSLCVIGSLLVMVACGLPMWKVTAFIEANIVVAQTMWDGLWMSCVVQSTGQMQCKVHDSVLALSHDLQAARALTIISSVMGVLGLMVVIAGAQCTNSAICGLWTCSLRKIQIWPVQHRCLIIVNHGKIITDITFLQWKMLNTTQNIWFFIANLSY